MIIESLSGQRCCLPDEIGLNALHKFIEEPLIEDECKLHVERPSCVCEKVLGEALTDPNTSAQVERL